MFERHDRLEEVHRELRQGDREHRGRAHPDRSLEEPEERLAPVPERDVGREPGEEPVHRLSPAEEHRERDGEREDRAEENRLRAEVTHTR